MARLQHVAGDSRATSLVQEIGMDEQLAKWREDTPGCAYRVHLNNAGAALMPQPDLRAANWLTADTYELEVDARRFGNWEFAYSLVLGLGEAARYALSVSLDEAERRACQLAASLREKLAAIPGFRVLDHGVRLAAIVTAEVRGHDVCEIVH